MARGLFVTGTDTNVGKTVVAAALVALYRRRGPVRYWKPVQTGIEHDDDTAVVARLAGCTPGEIVDAGIRLPRPVSPHLAARLAGTAIDVEGVIAAGPRVGSTEHFWIVEGAGGVLVPLNETETMIDLMVRVAQPAIVVSRTTLGTINHTLLTIEALRRRRVEVACVVMSGDPEPETRQAIAHHGAVTVVEFPVLRPLAPAAVAAWAERAGRAWPI